MPQVAAQQFRFVDHRSICYLAPEVMSSRTPLRLFLAWTWVDVEGDIGPWESSGLKDQPAIHLHRNYYYYYDGPLLYYYHYYYEEKKSAMLNTTE